MFLFHFLTISLLSLNPAPAHAEKPQPNLELKLSLSKSEIVQLEPIALTISVQNLSNEPQEIVSPVFDPDAQHLKIFVTTKDGKSTWLRSGTVKCIYTGTTTFSPKDVIRYRLLLSGEPKEWMDTPGEYQLHITFLCLKDPKPLESQPVKLTVKPAEGIDKEALDRFRGYPQALFLGMRTTAPAIGGQFRIVTQEFPKSVYAPWCYYILGWSMQNSREAFASDASQAVAARDYYGQLLEKYPKFPLKTEVEYEMARELLRMGEDEGGIEQIEDLASKHSDLWLFRCVDMKLKSFRDKGKVIPANSLPPHYGL